MIVGIGIDVIDLERVTRLIDSKGERALRRLFTPGEAEFVARRADPVRHLAARLAAKEAAFKALAGNELARGIGWRDIEVVREDSHPALVLHGRAALRAEELGLSRSWLTLTHSAMTAAAFVVLERD